MLTITDLKAMLDRYQDNLNYYENKIRIGESMDAVYKQKIMELRSKVYHVSKELDTLMDSEYETKITKV